MIYFLICHSIPGQIAFEGTKAIVIMLTCSYNVNPLYKPLLYYKIWIYRGIHYFLIFDLKHRFWVLVRTASMRRLQRVPTIYVLSKNIRILHLRIDIVFFNNSCIVYMQLLLTNKYATAIILCISESYHLIAS